jgi:hypothetical protein
LRLRHDICDSLWLRAFWSISFEGEVVHKVTQSSPKFNYNPLAESGDRLMGSWELTRGSYFPILSREGSLTALGRWSNHPG